MCCFTGPVSSVSDTTIFARWLTGRAAPRQALAYQMKYSTGTEVAMVLPLPVPKGGGPDTVTFLNLEKEPKFFEKLEKLFPESDSVSKAPVAAGYGGGRSLPVVKVGSFDASFVPSQADFVRLDPRFRMKDKLWDKLPQYRDWGFAVFKLRRDSTTVHPMALSFLSSQPEAGLFFPTVHVHDGEVHEKEEFSHTLYCQMPSGLKTPPGWMESEKLPLSLGELNDADLLDPRRHVYRKYLNGMLPNTDTLV